MSHHTLEALAVMAWLGVIALTVAWATNRGEIRALRAEVALLRHKLDLPALQAQADSWTQRTDLAARQSACRDGPDDVPDNGRMVHAAPHGIG